MTSIDIFIALPLCWGAWNGYRRGILIEIISIIAFIISVLAGLKLLGLAVAWLSPYLTTRLSQRLVPYLGFSIIFFPIIFLIVRLGWLLRRTIRYTILGSFDSITGAIVGVFTWAFGISIFFWAIITLGIKLPKETTQGAYLYPMIKPIAPKIIEKATTDWIPRGTQTFRKNIGA